MKKYRGKGVFRKSEEVEKIVDSIAKEMRDSNRRKQEMLYIISYIISSPNRLKEKNDGFTLLHSATMARMVSKVYLREYLDLLLELGILDTDNHYVSKQNSYQALKSIGYKVRAEWTEGKLDKWISYRPSLEIIRKHIDLYSETTQVSLEGRDGYRIAFDSVKRIKVDLKAHKKYIKEAGLTEGQVFYYDMSAEKLKREDYFGIKDDNTGRFFTNLSSYPSPIRHTLTVGGKKLWGVDIPNSQPLFLGLLIKSRDTADAEEIDRYLKVCAEGLFYESLAELAGEELDLNDHETRKDFKQRYFRDVLFGKNYPKLSEFEKIFRKAYPTIFTAIRQMKVDNHKILSKDLQSTEANFIYKSLEIAKTFIDKNAPLTTIHDCIVTNKDSIFMVSNVMMAQFSKVWDLEIELKEELA